MDNYFELFDLETSYNIDAAVLKKKFYQLSRDFHPDRFTTASNEEQETALSKSTLINSAYKALDDDWLRLKHILALKGQLVEDEKYALPAAFLMEMMEINEAIADGEDNSKVVEQIGIVEEDLKTEVLSILESDLMDDASLQKVKAYYFKMKYLKRLQNRLNDIDVEI